MTQALYITVAFLAGTGLALQVAMLGAMRPERGPVEATFVSAFTTIGGLAVILGIRAVVGGDVSLPAPLNKLWPLIAVAAISGVGLAATIRGVPLYFTLTGLMPLPFLIGAGFLGPRIGVGLYISSVIAGQLIGSVVIDHIGAFGIPAHKVDLLRAFGVLSLLLGVVLIRGVR